MKLLNIGAPFHGLSGGDKQRGTFEWEALSQAFEVDNLLVANDRIDERLLKTHQHHGTTYALQGKNGDFHQPDTIFNFDRVALKEFEDILRAGKYDVVFFRYIAASRLASLVKEFIPNAKVVVDADMLNSRIASQAWQQNRSISNRFFLLESFKVRRYEKKLFNMPYLLTMSNSNELDFVKKHYITGKSQSKLALIPNVMPETDDSNILSTDETQANYILFHGMLTSSVNIDAFRFMVEDIYPLLHPVLKSNNVFIRVVGRGLSDFHRNLIASNDCSQIELVGEVDDIGAQVREAILCLIPLRMGSGTKTRVLEAAAFKKCVVTTSLGAEGLEFGEEEIVVHDQPDNIAQALSKLLLDRPRVARLAANLFQKSSQIYSQDIVGKSLVKAIQTYGTANENAA